MIDKTLLGEVIKIQHGYAFQSDKYVDKSSYRLVTLGNFEEGNNCFKYNDAKATYYGADFPKEFELSDGDLIMPLTEQVMGLFGNSAFVPKNSDYTFVLNQRVGKVICDETKIDRYYAHYLLATDSVKRQLEARATGTRQRNISPDDVYSVEVFLPDLPIQKQIGKLLYDLEQKQELNKSICSDLEALAKEIYDYWFVQFDFPDENGKPYKSSGGKMVWNEELNREIPDGWKVTLLSDFASLITKGTTPSTLGESFVNDSEVSFVKVESIEGGHINGNIAHISKNTHNKMARSQLMENDILITIAGRLGAVCSVDKYVLPANTNQAVGIVRLKNADLMPFVKRCMMSDANQYYYQNVNAQSIQKNLNLPNIGETIILCDESHKIIKRFCETTYSIEKRIVESIVENQQLTSLRDFLLPMLMNGQIKIEA